MYTYIYKYLYAYHRIYHGECLSLLFIIFGFHIMQFKYSSEYFQKVYYFILYIYIHNIILVTEYNSLYNILCTVTFYIVIVCFVLCFYHLKYICICCCKYC